MFLPASQEREPSMKETLEEFLARGGVVVKLDPAPQQESKHPVSSTVHSNNIYALDEGALYFAERSPSRKTMTKVKLSKPKKKRAPKLNLSLLPPELVALVSQAEETSHEETSQPQVLREGE